MIEQMHTQFKSYCSFPVTKEQYERYRNGGLWQQWLKDYPNIFDEDDQKVAQKNAHRGVGFYESLASDSLRANQIALFDNLLRLAGKPIYIMQFTQLD